MAYAMRRRAPVVTLSVVVVAFLAYSLPPYLSGGTRVPATFAWHYPLLVLHVLFGSVAMVTAVAQFWPGLRVGRPTVHRRVGRLYVSTAVPAAVCAMVIGAATPFGPFLAVSNVILASLWLWYTINGYVAARTRSGAVHLRYMVLSATLALSTITNRIWSPALMITLRPLQDSVFGGDDQLFLWFAAGAGAWLGWSIPFLSMLWWLNRRSVAMPPSSSRLTDSWPMYKALPIHPGRRGDDPR
jgi:uncharacterized membrane protein